MPARSEPSCSAWNRSHGAAGATTRQIKIRALTRVIPLPVLAKASARGSGKRSAAVGAPLGKLVNDDIITIDVEKRRIDMKADLASPSKTSRRPRLARTSSGRGVPTAQPDVQTDRKRQGTSNFRLGWV